MWSPSAEYRHTWQMLSSALEIWPLTFITVCLTFDLSPGLWRSAHRWQLRWKRPVVRCTTQTGNDPRPYRHDNWKWTSTRRSRVWWWCLKKIKNLNNADLFVFSGGKMIIRALLTLSLKWLLIIFDKCYIYIRLFEIHYFLLKTLDRIFIDAFWELFTLT